MHCNSWSSLHFINRSYGSHYDRVKVCMPGSTCAIESEWISGRSTDRKRIREADFASEQLRTRKQVVWNACMYDKWVARSIILSQNCQPRSTLIHTFYLAGKNLHCAQRFSYCFPSCCGNGIGDSGMWQWSNTNSNAFSFAKQPSGEVIFWMVMVVGIRQIDGRMLECLKHLSLPVPLPSIHRNRFLFFFGELHLLPAECRWATLSTQIIFFTWIQLHLVLYFS